MIQAPASREIYRGSQTIVTGILAVTGFRVWMTLNQMACRLASHPGCSAQAITHDMIAIEPRCLLMDEKPINTVRPSHVRSEEHTSELKSLMRISSAVFCLKNK